MTFRPKRIALILAALLLAPAIASADIQYTVTELGALPGDTESWPTAINSLGQVVGYSAVPGANYNAWLYSNGSLTPLGNPDYPGSQALAVNNVGQAVGVSNGPNLGGAFISSGGNMQYIGSGLSPTGINDSGTIIGNYFANAENRAFVYSGGTVQDLGSFISGGSAQAFAINNKGQITGGSGVGGATHAFLYTDGVMQDLGTLGGSGSGGYAINNLGDVAGSSRTALLGGIDHAFLYNQSDGMIDLGTLQGGVATFANGVNDSDQVVGYGDTSTGNRAFVYTGGTLYNLNDLINPSSGITLVEAVGINDSGQIIAWGDIGPLGQNPENVQAFLLTPTTPEPGTCAIAGIAALGLLKRRPRP